MKTNHRDHPCSVRVAMPSQSSSDIFSNRAGKTSFYLFFVISLVLTLLSAANAQSTLTYYVDNVNGNDSNSGTSASMPIRTIAKVNSLRLAPGQTVAFRAGEEWHEMLQVVSSGSQGTPITYTSYGNGAQPIISASDQVPGWSGGSGSSAQEVCSSTAFCSGFEAPGFADWDSVSNNHDATVTQGTSHVLSGSNSMALHTTNGLDTRAWVTKKFSATSEGSTVALRFYLYIPSGSLKILNNVRFSEFLAGSNSIGFAYLSTDLLGRPSSIALWDTADSTQIIPDTPLSGFKLDSWNEIELDLTTSANNGSSALYLNGNQIGGLAGRLRIPSWIGTNQLLFGNTAFGSALAAGQSIFFDDLRMQTSGGPIGVLGNSGPATIWTHSQPSDPKLINFAGATGMPVANSSLLTAPNQFAWDGSTLSVFSTANPASIVEVPQRVSAVTSNGASYITFSNLEFQGAQAYDVYCGYSSRSCDHWDFEGDTFNDSYSNELYFQPYPGAAASGPTVNRCTFMGGGANGIALSGPGATGATITHNQLHDLSMIYNAASAQNAYSDAIEGYSDGAGDGSGTFVGYNTIYNIGVGQSHNYGGGIHADTVNGWDIEHNTIQNTNGSGLQLEKGSSLTARYNLIVGGGAFQYNSGLMVRAGDGVSISNNVVENNTSYGGWWACSVLIQQNSGTVTVTNTSYEKNICDGAQSNTQFYMDAGLNTSSNAFLNNGFGVAGPYFIVFGGKEVDSYGQLNAYYGSATQSIAGDPLFTSVAQGLFSLLPTSPDLGLGALP